MVKITMSVVERAEYLADLSEEWVESTPPSAEHSKPSAMDFGSIVVRDSAASRAGSIAYYGTTIMHGVGGGLDQAISASPLSKGVAENSQLAWAAAALHRKGDLLADQTAKTPNRLQALFVVPSPPDAGTVDDPQHELPGQDNNAQLDQARAANSVNEPQLGDEVVSQDASTGPAPLLQPAPAVPPSADFSFHIAKQQRQSWRAHLPPSTPELGRADEALATSTPSAETGKRRMQKTATPKVSPSPSLGIFKFHHDTHTRQHLEALVREIDDLSSPPRALSPRRDREDDLVWLESLAGFRRAGAETEENAFDDEGRLSNTRSAKRVRLSMSELLSSRGQGHRASTGVAKHAPATPQTERRLQRLAQSARKSTAQGSRSSTPRRPPLRVLPPTSMPVRRTLRSALTYSSPAAASYALRATHPAPVLINSPQSLPKGPLLQKPANVVKDKLQEAKALMDRIKARTSERQQQEEHPKGRVGEDLGGLSNGRPSGMSTLARPPNPTPMTATMGHAFADLPSQDGEKAQVAASVVNISTPDLLTPEDERLDALAPLPIIHAPNAAATASVRQNLYTSQHVLSAAGGPGSGDKLNGKRVLLTAALDRQRPPIRPALSFSSQASSERFFTSTSTRVPSGSTAATSMMGSVKSDEGRKVPVSLLGASLGPVLVTPNDVADLLTEDVLGDMLFERDNQRWVRKSGAERKTSGPSSGVTVQGLPAAREESEDDPFRDITGFESSSKSEEAAQAGHVRHRRSGSLTFAIKEERSLANTEKTSTPPVNVSAVLPLLSPDLPGIQPAAQPPQPPRSALKNRIDSFSTPLTGNRTLVAGERSKLGRSVSFSDGRSAGRIMSGREAHEQRASALRHEVHSPSQEGHEPDAADASEEDEADGEDESANCLHPGQVGNVSGQLEIGQSLRTLQTAQGLYHVDGLAEHIQSPSEQSTPTASLAATGRSRSLRLRARNTSTSTSASTLAWQRKPQNANATLLTECSFGVSHDRLLQVLTDVAPFEPCWKELRRLNLADRGLESTIRLKDFLPKLDELDLAKNALAYLTGLPGTLRFLSLPHNKLSSLTSFSHLSHLETLDISHSPALNAVHQLSCLKHLRTLHADRCAIDDVEGVSALDGLVHVSLKGNRLSRLELELSKWRRLESLDVSENCISEVTGVETLPALKTLNLDHNKLCELAVYSPAHALRILKLSHNSLATLDLAQMPNLRTVFADSNSICEVTGTARLRNLENLSLREQRRTAVVLPVRDLRDIRRLYLSHNPIPSTFPTSAFLNLVLLELTSSGLTALPTDFSALVPNCRVLVLAYNFLADLGPLGGMRRLKQLSVLGNRLEKVKSVLGTLRSLPELALVDLRLNPMTLGFYAPPSSSTSSSTLSNPDTRDWTLCDTRFRRSLPTEWLAKRAAYRALMMESSESLRYLDGLRVGTRQREAARQLTEVYDPYQARDAS
ncbi:MAG: hypothetical protein CYPHOPRED_002105 [Cyphobasidiales sp. Tagirdzhanova-0007]|nr:MAG: hypothetical protein CYPHOPRED_002105 [Cyphobasidiales sp. Tagirdzhanova-0007]